MGTDICANLCSLSVIICVLRGANMIELGNISIKDETSIVEARNKIRILAEDLKFDSITATRLATMTSELSRRMVTADLASNIEVGLDKRGGALSLVLLFASGKTMPALDIKTLEAVFDDVDEFQTMDRLESIRTFKFLPDPELELTEEFIGKERELVQRLTREELYLQLRDAHEELVRKEKLAVLGQMAGGVAHELRNPLGVISNAIYYLKIILSDPDETTMEYLDIITSEVRNSDKIVSDLLGFSRTRAAEREKIALSELVDQALEKQPSPERIKVTKEIASDLPLVFIDPRQIDQVLFNLITNAFQAMTE